NSIARPVFGMAEIIPRRRNSVKLFMGHYTSECWAVVHGLARLGKAEFQNHFLPGLPIAEARGLKRRGLWPKSCRMNTYPKMRMGRIEKRRRKAAASFQPCERGFPVPSTVASLPQSRGALREALSFVRLNSPSLGARMCLFGRSKYWETKPLPSEIGRASFR